MEDEYYTPTMRWSEEDEFDEEVLADGDLPSLKRVNSAGSRGSASQWRAAVINQKQHGDGHYGGDGDDDERRPAQPFPSEAASAAAAAAAVAMDRQANSRDNDSASQTTEQLKVAGFWKQLDANVTNDTDERSVDSSDDDGSDMPNDERKWRRGMSPPRNRSSGRRGAEDDGEYANQRNQSEERQKTKHGVGSGGTAQWNLLEKAAYYANEDTADYEDEEALGTETDKHQRVEVTLFDDEDDEEDQSLDRTRTDGSVDTNSASGTDTQGRLTAAGGGSQAMTKESQAAVENDDDDDNETGILACISVALATMCGSAAVSASTATSKDDGRKKRRAPGTIDKKDQSKLSVNAEEDEEAMTEDAAIELQFHSDGNAPVGDGEGSGINGMAPFMTPPSPGGSFTSNGDVTSPKSKKMKKSIKKLFRMPSSKKKKKNAHDGNEDEEAAASGSPSIVSPRKTLVTTTTRSGKTVTERGGSTTRVTDYLSSLTFEQEILGNEDGGSPSEYPGSITHKNEADEAGQDNGENSEADDENDNDNKSNTQETNPNSAQGTAALVGAAAIAGAAALATESTPAATTNTPKNSLYDEEELESEAAAWSSNKKNLYLRQLAERAKMEYATNAGTASAANDGADRDTAGEDANSQASAGVATGVAATGAVVARGAAVTAVTLSRAATSENNGTGLPGEAATEDTQGKEPGAPSMLESSYNVDYNSFSPTEKRQFLKNLNSGMNPQDAAIALERGGHWKTTDHAAVTDVEDNEDEKEGKDNDLAREANAMYVMDGPGEGPVTRSSRFPNDEDMPLLMSEDPVGVVLQGASGESAELLTRDNEEEGQDQQEVVSPPHAAQGSSKSLRVGAIATLATIPLVPAMVFAKSRSSSKSKERNQIPMEQQDQENYSQQQQKEEEVPATPRTDGLLSDWEDLKQSSDGGLVTSGISYYDAQDRGLDTDENKNDNNNSYIYSDSGPLAYDNERASAPTSGSRPRKGKLLGAAVASGLAAKVASRRHGEGGAGGGKFARRNRYKNISTKASSSMVQDDSRVVVAAASTSPADRESTNDQREAKSDFSSKSPRSLSSALNFMNISKPVNIHTPKKEKSSKWEKLDSDLALDQVAPSRSVELDGMPSWLLPRDDSMEEVAAEQRETEEEEETKQEDAGQDAESEYQNEQDENTASETTEPIVQQEHLSQVEGGEERREGAEENINISHAALPIHRRRPTEIDTQSSPSISSEQAREVPSKSNVVTPTASPGNINNDTTVTSRQPHTDSSALSPGDSLVFSPGSTACSSGTLSQTSSEKDLQGGCQEHKQQNEEESKEPAQPAAEDTASQLSYATGTGSTRTTASKPHRIRHKGAAKKRLLEAKQAEEHNAVVGWLDSIRDAASTQGQIWDPERGWVHYSERDEVVYAHDCRPIGSLHLTAIPSKQAVTSKCEPDSKLVDLSTEPLGFPSSLAKEEGHTMVESLFEQPVKDLDEDFMLNTSTVDSINTVDASSLFSFPTHRSSAKHITTNRRKTTTATAQSQTDSLERPVKDLEHSNVSSVPTRRSSPRHVPTDHRKTTAGQDNNSVYQPTESLGFPSSLVKERDSTAGPSPDHQPTTNSLEKPAKGFDDGFIFDTATVYSVNTTGASSVSSAPTRRSSPRHVPTDRRKIVAATGGLDKRSVGWKQSMENATSQLMATKKDCFWEYEKGWIQEDGTSVHLPEGSTSPLEHPESAHQASQNQCISPVAQDSVSPDLLPSVAEEVLDPSSDESNHGDAAMRKVTEEEEEEEDKGRSYNFFRAAMMADNGSQSDKENQDSMSEHDSSSAPSQQPPLQQQQPRYDQTQKQSLHQWLEKHSTSNNNGNDASGPLGLDESEDAVASREMSKELSSHGTATRRNLLQSNTDSFIGKTKKSDNGEEDCNKKNKDKCKVRLGIIVRSQ